MKKIVYTLLFMLTLVASSCNEELPQASFELYELKSAKATAGDMSAVISWEADERAHPSDYLIIWTPSSSEVEGGQMTVDAAATSTTIDHMVNDVAYTISIQPRYNGRLASKSTVACTPKNARYPVTNLTAASGDQKVRLKWTKPASERYTKYQITINPGNQVIDINDISAEEYIVTGLTNGQIYTLGVASIYPTGNSDKVEATATPGAVEAINVAKKELVVFESSSFSYNDMYFIKEVKSVHWDFGDGAISSENSPFHLFATPGAYTVKATVTYSDNTTESGSLNMTVVTYKWDTLPINFGGLTGYVKVSNPVFSPDGKTLYFPTSSPNGNLFAVDVASGEFKWGFAIPKITYGGGTLVGNDGTIYQCVEDATANNVYAIQPNGTEKWSVKLNNKIGASPALSKEGTLYCLTNGSTLYALNAATGAIYWQQSLDGATAGAVAIGKDGNIYAGTYSGIYAFNPQGQQLWKLEGVAVTERGAFALDGTTLYATQRAKAGLIAINTVDGSKKWAYASTGGDAYFPIVDKTGTVYFSEKGANMVYAVSSNGSKKWATNVDNPVVYCGIVLASDGTLYVGSGTQASNQVVGLNSVDGAMVYQNTIGGQVMASCMIGPDQRLYIGTIGSGNIGSIRAFAINKALESTTWSVRGGDMQGTNRQK